MKCIICGMETDWGKMYGDRCIDCQKIGFGIWGFGEYWEKQRDKESLDTQRAKILKRGNKL